MRIECDRGGRRQWRYRRRLGKYMMKRAMSEYGAVLLAGALLQVGGCWGNGANTPEIVAPREQANPLPQDQATAARRVQGTAQHLSAYDATARHLPAPTDFLQRAIMEDLFQDLSAMLPLLEGPDADAIFRQQLHVVQMTREQLISPPSGQSPDRIVSMGLRAAYEAFEDMGTTLFSDLEDLPDALNLLSGKLDDLDDAVDSGQGASIRQLEGDSVRLIGDIIGMMNTALSQRLQTGSQAPTQSATQPAEVPATRPATLPVRPSPPINNPF